MDRQPQNKSKGMQEERKRGLKEQFINDIKDKKYDDWN